MFNYFVKLGLLTRYIGTTIVPSQLGTPNNERLNIRGPCTSLKFHNQYKFFVTDMQLEAGGVIRCYDKKTSPLLD